eukprot:TRINITY_DN14631_c0_g1_i1.p1 TRINITY_DN14631_c0_g1~~TRINITY_DN14631_c0_g1_i1.p1  ORF type:complete len:100 (+),score=10.16 TRINITY_DN14631_c0_g1_i1:52-351(+)
MSLLGLQIAAREAVKEGKIHTKSHKRLLTNLDSMAQLERSTRIKKHVDKGRQHGMQHMSNLLALGDLDGSEPLSLSTSRHKPTNSLKHHHLRNSSNGVG